MCRDGVGLLQCDPRNGKGSKARDYEAMVNLFCSETSQNKIKYKI